ncbi:hypothetical protein [Flavonifractor sp. An10]|uniref:hypothetical protein n=1 Tax=Flavonifractor sp. An10 TaxID=1965537 RepID=UPI0013A61271|nr:hypothetical protein [Flavonifractor sp. An10]
MRTYYFETLKNLNERTRKITDCNITQFSDSIIFSLSLNKENYRKLITILAEYQLQLLYNSILCRGAIAYGKHYKENDFMFSQALIEAYQLELNDAIYPRIIVSQNLFEFFKPDVGVNSLEHVLKENDGFWFIDYLGIADKDTAQYQLKKLNDGLNTENLHIKEKYYWLYRYWEYTFGEKLSFAFPQFSK